MRYVFGFICVCALGVVPLAACDLVADCESCAGVVCPDDGNECTEEYCSCGRCQRSPLSRTDCDFDGLVGVCIDGQCGEDLCEGVVCDGDDECADGVCNFRTGNCEYILAWEGTPCDGGFCVDGVCDTRSDQCTAADLAAMEEGDEPDTDTIADSCDEAHLDPYDCLNPMSECLQESGTTLSDECQFCFASKACCTLNACGPFAGGPCQELPWADICDMCIQEKCQPQVDVCVGGP